MPRNDTNLLDRRRMFKAYLGGDRSIIGRHFLKRRQTKIFRLDNDIAAVFRERPFMYRPFSGINGPSRAN